MGAAYVRMEERKTATRKTNKSAAAGQRPYLLRFMVPSQPSNRGRKRLVRSHPSGFLQPGWAAAQQQTVLPLAILHSALNLSNSSMIAPQ